MRSTAERVVLLGPGWELSRRTGDRTKRYRYPRVSGDHCRIIISVTGVMSDMESLSRRAVLRWMGLGTAVVLAGCGSLPSPFTSSPPPETPDYVRPCSERLSGSFVPDDADIVVGPVTFATTRSLLRTASVNPNGMRASLPLAIAPGPAVTLVVPEADREHVALNYNPQTRYTVGAPLETAQQSVRFAACGAETPRQYNGGIIVAGARCVTLDVWIDGKDTPRKALLPFGTSCD